MIYHITPVPKPRQSQRDKWQRRPEVMRYRAFADACRAQRVELPDAGAYISFWLPMPPSWSKKKRGAHFGQPHQQKPDLSNLLKALEDAVRDDDERVWSYTANKYWGITGGFSIHDEDSRYSAYSTDLAAFSGVDL